MGLDWSCPVFEDYGDYADYGGADFNASDCNCSDPTHIFNIICDCDYPAAPPPPLDEVLPLGIVYGIVFLLGTIGNTLVIVVVRKYKRMRNVTNLFLASLSTADLLLIWFCVPLQYLKYLSYNWFMGHFLCVSVHYVQQLTRCCSVITLTTISIERFMAIAYPMKTMWLSSIGRAKKVIVAIWMLSILLATPTAFRMNYYSDLTARNLTASQCQRRFSADDYEQHEELEQSYCVYQFVLLLILPLSTMTFCYTRIVLIVHRSSRNKMLHEGRALQLMIHASKSIGLTAPAATRSMTRLECDEAENDGLMGRNPSTVKIQEPFETTALAAAAALKQQQQQQEQLEQEQKKLEQEAIIKNSSSKNGTSSKKNAPPKVLLPVHVSLQDSNRKMSRLNLRRRAAKTSDNNRKQIVKMLCAIVILYTICWTPALVDELLTSYQFVCDMAMTTSLKQFRMICAVLTYANSCINPIVYGFMSTNFRRTFITVCGCYGPGGGIRHPNATENTVKTSGDNLTGGGGGRIGGGGDNRSSLGGLHHSYSMLTSSNSNPNNKPLIRNNHHHHNRHNHHNDLMSSNNKNNSNKNNNNNDSSYDSSSALGHTPRKSAPANIRITKTTSSSSSAASDTTSPSAIILGGREMDLMNDNPQSTSMSSPALTMMAINNNKGRMILSNNNQTDNDNFLSPNSSLSIRYQQRGRNLSVN